MKQRRCGSCILLVALVFARLSSAALPTFTKRRCASVIESLQNGEDLVEGERKLGLLPAGILSGGNDCLPDDPCWATAHPEPQPNPPLSGAEGIGYCTRLHTVRRMVYSRAVRVLLCRAVYCRVLCIRSSHRVL